MDLDRAALLEREVQDLYSSHQHYHSLASKSRIVESQLLTLTVQSLNRYSFALQTDNRNSIGQLKDMVLDKIGAWEGVHGLFYEGHQLSDEWIIADRIIDIKSLIYIVYTAGSTLTSNDAIHVTNADTGERLPVDSKSNAQCTSAGGIFSITDSDHTSGDDDVINLVTPHVAHDKADKSDDGELLHVQVMKLLEMSFSSKAEITLALVAASRDLDRAIEYLFNGIPEKRKALAELYIALKGIMVENDPGNSGTDGSLVGSPSAGPSAWSHMFVNGEALDMVKLYGIMLENTPPGHRNRSEIPGSLGITLRARFNRTGDRADLDTAIEYHEQTPELQPPGHSDRWNSLNNIAVAISDRFDQAGDRANLDTAIKYLEKALELLPPGHSDRSSSLSNLAGVIKARFDYTQDRTNLDRAMLLIEETCCRENAQLRVRFRLSVQWAHMSHKYACPPVLYAFATALELLETLVTMSRSLDSRHSRMVNDMLGHAKSLASDAAAVALDQEQPQRAVELLEQGQGQLALYRTALDDLQAVSLKWQPSL
ncbi:hypothetical protein FRB98_007729 [Tulasnella sp. 332]|nr:hypothetical protein FRB98_007729 [Tulasnella sp. 332]